MRRLILPALLLSLVLAPARADALTIRDIIDLTRAGLGDDILLALIEVDRSVLPVDTATLRQLKEAGVSERVILAVVRSGRLPPPPAPVVVAPPEPEPPPPPQVVVIEHREHVREVPVAVPVYVPVPVSRTYPRHAGAGRATEVRTPGARTLEPHKPAEPVYWGFGGKLRPDAWKPAPSPPREKSGG